MTLVKSSVYLFSRRLAHPLPCDVRQVVVFIVRFMVSPHNENNLQPLRPQSPKRLGMAMSFSPLIPIVSVRPLTAVERGKGKQVRSVAQMLVTGKAKLYDMAFAAGSGHRDYSRLGLKVLEGLPSTLGISQLRPDRWHQGAALSSRQRLGKLSGRGRGEKTLDPLSVGLNCGDRGLKLVEQHLDQLCLGSDHMLGNHQLRLVKLLPQLITARLAEMMLLLGEAVPLCTAKLAEGRRGRIRL